MQPIGWVVIAREDARRIVSLTGFLDYEFANGAEAAIARIKAGIQADCSAWKFAAFGVMQWEHLTKVNLAAALYKLDLYGCDPDEVYAELSICIADTLFSH